MYDIYVKWYHIVLIIWRNLHENKLLKGTMRMTLYQLLGSKTRCTFHPHFHQCVIWIVTTCWEFVFLVPIKFFWVQQPEVYYVTFKATQKCILSHFMSGPFWCRYKTPPCVLLLRKEIYVKVQSSSSGSGHDNHNCPSYINCA